MLIEVTTFKGLVPKIIDPALLPVGNSQKAVNCRFDHGGVSSLEEDTPVQDLSSPPLSIYRNSDGNFFVFSSDTDICTAPLANDAYGRVFFVQNGSLRVTDQSLYKKGTGNYPRSSYNPSPLAPVSAPTVTAYPSTGDPTLEETRGYVYTYVNGYGSEGPPSPVSNLVDLWDGDTVVISGIVTSVNSDYNVKSIRIYRINQSSTGAQFQFVAEVNILDSTYTDTELDSSLGEVLPSLEWDAAPTGIKGLIALPNGSFAGFFGNTLCFSEPYYPHAWPVKYQKSVDKPIVGLGSFGTTVAVLTSGKPKLAVGDQPSNVVMEDMDLGFAAMSKRGIVQAGDMVIYPSPEGLIAISPTVRDNLTELLLSRENWSLLYNPPSITAFFWEGHYVAFYTKLSGETAGFIFNIRNKELNDISFVATAGYRDPGTGILFLAVI